MARGRNNNQNQGGGQQQQGRNRGGGNQLPLGKLEITDIRTALARQQRLEDEDRATTAKEKADAARLATEAVTKEAKVKAAEAAQNLRAAIALANQAITLVTRKAKLHRVNTLYEQRVTELFASLSPEQVATLCLTLKNINTPEEIKSILADIIQIDDPAIRREALFTRLLAETPTM